MAKRTKQRRWATTIEGVDELMKYFDEVSGLAAEATDAGAKKAAELVEGDAKRRVKVDTGALRDSITHKGERNKKDNRKTYRIFSQGGKKGVRYGFVQEYGAPKRGIKGKPFLRPALDENKDEIIKIVSEEIVKATGRAK